MRGRKPNVVFLNQSERPVEWFMRGPSLAKIEKLGWAIRRNETGRKLEPEEWAEEIADADAVMTTWSSPRLDEVVLGKNRNLKIVAHVGGSVAPYIGGEVYRRGIRVTSSNKAMARTVAESTLMLILMGMRRIHLRGSFGTRSKPMEWGKDKSIRVPQDCRIGIWGYGDISAWLVKLLRPFEPREILVNSGHLSEEAARREGMRKVEFDDLFAESHVVVCLAGMTVANTGRVGEEQLASIPDDGVLVNVGRAPLIQPDALMDELRRRRITGVFDVFEEEPLPEEDPLYSLDNVILTPHCAGSGRDASYMAEMLEEIERCLEGKQLKYEIPRERARTMTDLGTVREAQKKGRNS